MPVSSAAFEERSNITELWAGVMAKLGALFLFGVSALFCAVAVSVLPEGVRLDEVLASQAIPVEAMSQCADQRFCDDSTPGTGHGRRLFPDLTDDVVAVERCYSNCFGQVGQIAVLHRVTWLRMIDNLMPQKYTPCVVSANAQHTCAYNTAPSCYKMGRHIASTIVWCMQLSIYSTLKANICTGTYTPKPF